MLDSYHLNILLNEFNLPEGGRALVERIRSSQPSRRVGSDGKNVCVRYQSNKMGVTIQAESHTVEFCFIYEQEYDDSVFEYYDQPESIKLKYKHIGGKNIGAMHTPDFFIISKTFIGYVECKTEEHLFKLSEKNPTRYVQDENGIWRCPPGEEAAAEFGLSYKLWSDASLNWIFQENIRFLEDYFRPNTPKPDAILLQKVFDILRDRKWMTILSLIEIDDINADVVYWMISHEKIHVDIYSYLLTEPERAYSGERDT